MSPFKDRAVEALEEAAALLALAGEGPFRVRAYEAAARAVAAFAGDLEGLVWRGGAATIPGIGKGIAGFLREVLDGRTPAILEEGRRAVPATLLELLRVPGLGPARVRSLWERIGVETLEDLDRAAGEGRLAALPGFGEKTARRIREGVAAALARRGWCLLPEGLAEAEAIREALAAALGGARVEIAGAARRRREVIAAHDFVAAAPPEAARGAEEGARRLSPLRPVRVLAAPAGAFGSAWIRATGSAEHLAALAARGPLPEAPDEGDAYAALGLSWIPPERREGMGEVEAAARGGGFPSLDLPDLAGTFHVHTTESDGAGTLEEMVGAAKGQGLAYVGISDHSRTASYAGGLDPARLGRQAEAIRALGDRLGIRVLHGSEVDILPDGSLDFDDETLGSLDFVVASVHSRFEMDRGAMTERVLRAIRHPAVTILGHMTGRLLLGRDGYAIDDAPIFAEAARCGVAIELNAHPSRLDVDWRRIPALLAAGASVAIDPDAHAPSGLADLAWGVAMARKGGVPRDRVLNARPASEILAARRERLRVRPG